MSLYYTLYCARIALLLGSNVFPKYHSPPPYSTVNVIIRPRGLIIRAYQRYFPSVREDALGNSLDKLRHQRSVAYSAEQVR